MADSIDRDKDLTRADESLLLDTLTDEFGVLFERMQCGQASRASESLFSASPEELGQAAVEAAGFKPQ